MRTAIAAVLVAVGLLAACSSHGPHRAAFCAGTTPRTQVVVYSTTGLEYWFSDAFSTFQQACDVAITYVGAPSGAILSRLQAEKQSPLADVAILSPPEITTAADQDLIGGTPGASAVPADRCDHDRAWCALAQDYTSWVYNPDTIGTAPASWTDLLDARFKAAILTADPTTPIGLAQLVQLQTERGASAAFGYLQQLEASVVNHYTLSDTMSRVVAAGGALAASGDLQEDLNDIVQYRYVAVWFPDGATVEVPYGAALVRGGHNPANATALLRYLWSPAAQALAGESYAAPAVPTVVAADTRSQQVQAALKGVRIITPDWQSVATQTSNDDTQWTAIKHAPDGVSVPIPVPQVP